MTDDEDQILLPGRATSLAWLAVALACGTAEGQLALYHAIQVDVHRHGVTFAATDSYWLARSFVPFEDASSAWVPSFDEAPVARFVVVDHDWRVRDLMRFIEKSTRGCDNPEKDVDDVDLVITRNAQHLVDTSTPTLDPSLEAPKVFVEIPGSERIIVTESELGYPELGRLMRFQPKSALRLTFAPSKIQSVAQACQRVGSLGVKLNPTEGGAVAWEADFGEYEPTVHVSGLLMPLRDVDEESS